MSDELIMGAALILTVIFAVFFIRCQKKRKTGRQRFIEKAGAAGNCTLGTCEDYKLRLGVEESGSLHTRSDTMKVTYRYTVGGRAYRKRLAFQSPGKNSVDFPSTVRVYYDPRNPRRAVCPEEATWAHRRQTGCLLSIAATFLFLFLIFHFLRFLAGLFCQ